MRSPNCTSACWMWRGFLSSWRYSVICCSERCRPNHVFHQNRNGMRTMSHPVAKKRIFWVRDVERLGLDSGVAEPFEEVGTDVSDWTDMFDDMLTERESRKGTITDCGYS